MLAWPRRRRTASMDTPELKLVGAMGVAELMDAEVGSGLGAVALPAVVG